MSRAAELLATAEIQSAAYFFIVVCLLAVAVLLRRVRVLEGDLARTLSHRKSSEVRTGKIAEMLAPLSDSFPVNVKKPGTSTVFIGQPIDYIHFDPEEGVTFIEIKSGGSELTSLQQKIRSAVERGKIHWETVRIKGGK